mgnify:CR=1 FL=1
MRIKVAIIGLGYVGIPLAVEFAKKYPTIGFDIDKERVKDLMNGFDSTLEISKKNLQSIIDSDISSIFKDGKGLCCSTNLNDLRDCNFLVVTVPTPTDKNKRPILRPLIEASNSVGKLLKKGDYVVYESTVYPGVTEEECVPILEKVSGLTLNQDFYVGYSPERINPGDKEHSISNILKVTSGSTPSAANFIDKIYNSIIHAGTHLAPSIKVAEASKVIENSQRDINIAFVNELAKIFNKLNIDTHSVLEAAGTKWNFLKFKPGLVGGHCIGVDPYYLAQKAQESGYYPEIILAGRRINDSMGTFIASDVVKKMVQRDILIKKAPALILGFTFKENCPDIRNTRVIDIYRDLFEFGLDIDVYDPWVNTKDVEKEYGIKVLDANLVFEKKYSLILLAVAHNEFLDINFSDISDEKSIVYDIKSFLKNDQIDFRL